jgi:hypothetical protein
LSGESDGGRRIVHLKLDGKDTMTTWGMSQAWKALDNKTWKVIEKTEAR